MPKAVPPYKPGVKPGDGKSGMQKEYEWNKTMLNVYKNDPEAMKTKMGKSYAAKERALGTMLKLLKGKK